jgi:hypothetical protein
MYAGKTLKIIQRTNSSRMILRTGGPFARLESFTGQKQGSIYAIG